MLTKIQAIEKTKKGTPVSVEYIPIGKDAYLIEKRILLIFVKTALGYGLASYPVNSSKYNMPREKLDIVFKVFTDLHNEGTSKSKTPGYALPAKNA